MAFNVGGFTSAQDFTLFDDAMQRLRSSAFLTGITPSKEQTRGVVEAGLNIGAERASEREALGKQFALQQEQLNIQRSRNEALGAFEAERIGLAERGQRLKTIGGAGILAGLALFSPIFSSTTGKPTTIAGKIFKFFT